MSLQALSQPAEKCWADVITCIGATSANDAGPTWLCPSVQRWHNIVTFPTMTLCQRFANIITYCILLYMMVGTTLAQCIMNGWLSVGITSLSPIACRRLWLRKLVLHERLWHNCWPITVLTNKQHKAVNSGQMLEDSNSHTKHKV